MGELLLTTEGPRTFVDLERSMAALTEGEPLTLNLLPVHPFGYGDNPHQKAWFLEIAGVDDPLSLTRFDRVEGKQPSKSNYYDLARGRKALTRTAANFDVNQGYVPLIAIAMKHGNASGAAINDDDPEQAIKDAILGSNEDSFGSTFMTTFEIDEELAEVLFEFEKGDAPRRIMDVIAAPAITEAAIRKLRRYKGNGRILINPALANLTRYSLAMGIELSGDGETVSIQTPNRYILDPTDPTQQMQIWDDPYPAGRPVSADVLLAEGIASSSSSNTTTLVREGMVIGNGVGQQARHMVTRLAIDRAIYNNHSTEGASFATDSFFLKSDGPKMLIDAKVAEGIGTRRDEEKPGSEAIAAFFEAEVPFMNMPNSIGRGFTH